MILHQILIPDLMTLRHASPTFYRKYRGATLDSHLYQCLFGNFELSATAYILKFNIWLPNPSKDPLVAAKRAERNKERKGDLKTPDLVSMCLHMDRVDAVIDDVCSKALYNGQLADEIWGSLPAWTNSSILKHCHSTPTSQIKTVGLGYWRTERLNLSFSERARWRRAFL